VNSMSSEAPNLPADSLTASNALPVGTRVGEFEIRKLIGEGGFGAVYLAFDHSLRRIVAIKEYLPTLLAARAGSTAVVLRVEENQETFQAGMRSFINEARLLAQFDHPALVKVFRFWEENNTAYMAMPFYDGETLRSLAKHRPDLITEAWLRNALLPPLLNALETLHAKDVYHRDVSPDNILIQKNNTPVLLDFGAARRIISDRVEAVTVILKPGYAPIEQYSNDKCGPWSDVYAVCAVLYFLITGKTPPPAVSRVMSDIYEPLHLRADLPGYSADFLSAVDAGLALRPDGRPQTIVELRDLLLSKSAAVASNAPRTAAGAVVPEPSLDLDLARNLESAPPPAERTQEIQASVVPTEQPAPMQQGPESRSTPETAAVATEPSPAEDSTNASADFVVDDVVHAANAEPVLAQEPNAEAYAVVEKDGIGKDLMPKIVAIVLALIVGIFVLFHYSRPVPQSAPAVTDVLKTTAEQNVAKVVEAPVQVSPPPPTDEQLQAAAAAEEQTAWAAIRASRNAEDFRSYLAKYPSGTHAVQAQQKLAAMTKSPKKAANTSGVLLINVTPWGNVTVDGEDKGPSPPLKKLPLAAGMHHILIENPGLPPVTTDIEIKNGQNMTISHKF